MTYAYEPNATNWVIPFDKLIFNNEIGRGSFGTVYKGEYLGTPVAIKQLNQLDTIDFDLRKDFETEVSVMQSLRHPNIIMFMGLSQDKNNLYIVSEFCEGGALDDRFKEGIRTRKLPPWSIRIRICLETALALGYMHERNYIHRDLKSDNVLVDRHWHVKLSDFGLSRLKDPLDTPSYPQKLSAKGSLWWRAPEVDCGEYDETVDVFSFGIFISTLLTNKEGEDIREYIFLDLTKKGETFKYGVDSQKLKELWPVNTPKLLGDLAVQCCENDPTKRPSFEAIVPQLYNLFQSVLALEEHVSSVIHDKDGRDLWLSVSVAMICSGNVDDIRIPTTTVLIAIDEFLTVSAGKGLDFDHKEFISQLVSADASLQTTLASVSSHDLSSFLKQSWGEVTLSSFAQFWQWFLAVYNLIQMNKVRKTFNKITTFLLGFL
eukprot:TRINITY_DN3189_c0_g1_i2.p1 TRINITY_DN3189_c0_g1~~TRINITY_DN3189_c0_g1_i2.p1  ORF type:complete len:432 (-),score=65.44 TRINITY_DN3189_c0_g1_i2:480-1775(-)